MQKNTSFINVDQKNSKVNVTLSFDVTETNEQFVPKTELTFNTFSEILETALKERMNHCQKILTTEILAAEDKVFTSYNIYSNEIGKEFSIVAYKHMEEIVRILNSFYVETPIDNFIMQLSRYQVYQCIKAVATMNAFKIRDNLYRETVDILTEALLVKQPEVDDPCRIIS